LPIGISIQTDHCIRSERYPEEIEGAAYFLVCEALGNILKHASARQATVRLTSSPTGTLSIEVTDDGTGFDPTAATGSGLRGLKDRIEALGGSLLVASRRNEGTTLTATLPARAQHGI
jgi:signal transduction histidine kinase